MAARLGAAARDARLQAHVRLIDIATRAELSESTISRFEAGGGWRRDTDDIVLAYALELDTTPDALWRAALDRAE